MRTFYRKVTLVDRWPNISGYMIEEVGPKHRKDIFRYRFKDDATNADKERINARYENAVFLMNECAKQKEQE